MVTVLSVFMLSAPLVSGHAAADVVQVFTCLLSAHCSLLTHCARQLLVTLRCSTSTGIQEQESKERVTGCVREMVMMVSAPQQCLRVSDPRRG